MITILTILGISALCAISYESPYHCWVVEKLREKRPTEGPWLFLLNLVVCPQCYFYWLATAILLGFDFGSLSFVLGALCDIIGIILLKKIIRTL
ncbi:hypothetical protein UFOVP163_30 [uncultured Caudovirales phage]|uniref:DUF1360 domain-containing protein n=1 Tax=uncultured Caudovirales phage TaxID=2100421 RepID=A0A6J7WH63_9CAUD|nr:hypothetical protein UFOVP163_30 [uncultured Caudovirales phage]